MTALKAAAPAHRGYDARRRVGSLLGGNGQSNSLTQAELLGRGPRDALGADSFQAECSAPVHRIDLRPDLRPGGRRHGKTPYRGQHIGSSNSPIYAAARWLLDNGVARPEDTVATYRSELLCMSGKAGELAKWTVQEDDHGLRLVHWRPFPDAPYASKTAKLRATGTPLASAAFSGNSAKTLTSGTVAREGGAL